MLYVLVVFFTKYISTLYIGMNKVLQHHGHRLTLNFHFQCKFSSLTAEWYLWAKCMCTENMVKIASLSREII